MLFQSTLPGWGATASRAIPSGMESDFNPRSPDGERQSVSACNVFTNLISIHAPRMGSDMGKPTLPITLTMISIHAPRMGSDRVRPRCRGLLGDFNPRSPDGERPCVLAWQPPCLRISIHAPRMGSDPLWYTRLSPCSYFNPRSPDGERLVPRVRRPENGISIHAPRMGSDRARARRPQLMAGYFNPRSPDGERLTRFTTKPIVRIYFNPRSPDGERRMR